ncbi:sigma-70 family RNA polymerase sigma factor [Tamlana sp. 2201CG12-4]|uniref:RNA polymerase sigma factor n=1 Tax=Tamlana sp. 2201CG12-4 TaxID=3112582 RepID=UPI002DBC6F30|nr:sigma-70 family RNA polymerase sigma factor [Tamlana sp. 2201CG12-4]MEC3908837.1 sigma-70 family RNA polymerase sigma factor [Tamlana sp. 2201CG12-4]
MTINEKTFKKFKKGSLGAFKNIFESLYPTLVSFAVRHSINDMEGEDIVMIIFNKAWEKKSEFSTPSHLVKFLYTSVHNKSINTYRDKKNRERILNKKKETTVVNFEFGNILIEEELNRLLYLAIASLPQRRREVMELTLRGFSLNEIATSLDVSLNTVKTHKARAIKELRIKLKNHHSILLLLQLI